MTAARFVRFLGLALAFSAVSISAPAQQTQAPASNYQPFEGQQGKDVVWVPTPQALVDKMLDMAQVSPDDYVIDLGSGDGRTVITAAKRGARALGIEYNPDMVELSRRNAAEAGVADRVKFVNADLFKADLSQATVITMFLLPDINLKLRPRILNLKPGTRVVSNSFTMGDWEADEKVELDSSDGCDTSYCTALLWIVPAKVAGTHKLPEGELALKQNYQVVSGILRSGGEAIPVEGKVVGKDVMLVAGGRALHGKMNGRRIEFQ